MQTYLDFASLSSTNQRQFNRSSIMKTVLITGANRGIGLKLTQLYLENGWQVHATYREEQGAKQLFELKRDNLHCHQLDVTHYDKLPQFTASLPTIDLLINNAGYYGPKGTGFGDTQVEEWRKVFEVNTIAPLKFIEALYTKMRHGSYKKVVCISSKMASMEDNTSGAAYIYRSSKAALNSVVKSLSHELAQDGITVLALHPGWVQTDMGGPNALLDTTTSAQGLMDVIEGADMSSTGKFLNYDGTPLPW